MITLLKMPALFLGMLAVFCCLGSFFIRENRYESGHLGETVLFGFIAYYFLFELISVPMMVLGAKLHLLAWAVSYTHLSCRRIRRCRSRWSPYH